MKTIQVNSTNFLADGDTVWCHFSLSDGTHGKVDVAVFPAVAGSLVYYHESGRSVDETTQEQIKPHIFERRGNTEYRPAFLADWLTREAASTGPLRAETGGEVPTRVLESLCSPTGKFDPSDEASEREVAEAGKAIEAIKGVLGQDAATRALTFNILRALVADAASAYCGALERFTLYARKHEGNTEKVRELAGVAIEVSDLLSKVERLLRP